MVADAIAGITFAVVNVPQAMAHALLAAVNPVLGIYTLILAVPVGAVFTSSVFMNVSTTSALSVATASALSGIPEGQIPQALAALVLLAGAMQLLAGAFRLGFLLRFVPNSVMTGFLNGIAILVVLGQLDELTGFESARSNAVARALDLALNLPRVDVQSTAIGLLTLALITVLMRSRAQRYAYLVAVVAATALLFALSAAPFGFAGGWSGVETVGDIATIPRGLPSLTVPPLGLWLAMLVPAFSLAVIGLIQGAGVSQGYPNPNGHYPEVSRDFLGQGAANIAASLVGGLPAGGSVSGTILMQSAGARTRWANILAGIFVAVVVVAAANAVMKVPLPSLAALLIVAGVQGLRIEPAKMIWETGHISGVVMAVTLVTTLFLPLQYAVLFGIALSVVLHVVQMSNQVAVTEIVLVPGGLPVERPAPRHLPSGKLTLLQIYGSLFFAAAKSLEEMLPAVEGTSRAVVAIGLRGRPEVGSTFATVLVRYHEALSARQSKLMLVGVDEAVIAQLLRTGILDILGPENVFAARPQLGAAMNEAAAAAYEWLAQFPEDSAAGRVDS